MIGNYCVPFVYYLALSVYRPSYVQYCTSIFTCFTVYSVMCMFTSTPYSHFTKTKKKKTTSMFFSTQ